MALKPKGDIIRSPKQGYQTYVFQKLKKELCINLNFGSLGIGAPHLRPEKCARYCSSNSKALTINKLITSNILLQHGLNWEI